MERKLRLSLEANGFVFRPTKCMKMTSPLRWGCFMAAIFSSSTALALTINVPVTPAYVREHAKEWSVEVTRGKDGLIQFTIKHDDATPMYHVAHLAVYHEDKLIATSDTPSFGKKRSNAFCLSLAADDLAKSKFELSDSALSGTGDEAVPVVGTTVFQFRLLDFVPQQLAKPARGE